MEGVGKGRERGRCAVEGGDKGREREDFHSASILFAWVFGIPGLTLCCRAFCMHLMPRHGTRQLKYTVIGRTGMMEKEGMPCRHTFSALI